MSTIAVIPVTPVYPTFCRVKYRKQFFKDRKKNKQKYQCRGRIDLEV